MRAETILLVDDDAVCRRQGEAVLAAAGFQVAAAPDGEQAVMAATRALERQQPFDLAVLDYVMPGRDGFATFRELRLRQPDLAGLLLTGHTSLNVAIEALNRGFSQVVAKPLEPGPLVEAVEAALRERRTIRQNSRLHALSRLYDSFSQLAGLTEADELYQCIINLALAETSAHRASLMLLDTQSEQLRIVAASGLEVGDVVDGPALGEPISGWVLSHGVVLELGGDKPLPETLRQALRRPEISASVCFPLYAAGEPLGVLNLSRLQSTVGFGPGDVEIATVLATEAARTVHRQGLLQADARRQRVATVGRLASTIIHDLRGPVTIIGGAAEMLAETNPEAAEPLAEIGREVAELERTCAQLLGFARAPADAVSEPFALRDLVADALEATRAPAAEREIELCDEVAEVDVSGCRAELAAALSEVVAAAVEGGVPGTQLRFRSQVSGAQATLQLEGKAHRAADWWRPFDDPASLAVGGAGLSLAILRYLAERHHGRLDVAVEDRRYRLSLRLPRRVEEALPRPAEVTVR